MKENTALKGSLQKMFVKGQRQLKEKEIIIDGEPLTLFYDEYRKEWTVRDFAIEGFMRSRIEPIIHEILKR